MDQLLVIGAIGVALWLVSCALMVLLAARLPDGMLKQVVEFLPACVTTARRLRRHPDVPVRAKVALLVLLLVELVARPPAPPEADADVTAAPPSAA